MTRRNFVLKLLCLPVAAKVAPALVPKARPSYDWQKHAYKCMLEFQMTMLKAERSKWILEMDTCSVMGDMPGFRRAARNLTKIESHLKKCVVQQFKADEMHQRLVAKLNAL